MLHHPTPDRPPDERVRHVIQGSHLVSRDPAVVLTSILGFCVATCLWDPVAGIGGMNHLLLAKGPEDGGAGYRYGSHAIELLINDLLKHGAVRSRRHAKLFGGATMQNSFGRIGRENAEFALEFIRAEELTLVSHSRLGTQARRIRFRSTTGSAQQRLVSEADVPPVVTPARLPDTDITFF